MITDASDVFFVWLMKLPTYGGSTMRIACGSTTKRRISGHVMPSACDASVCPRGTARMPARMISALYAAELIDSAMIAAGSASRRSPNSGAA